MKNKNTPKVVSAIIGNALEWYDFLIYGFLAATIAQVFFPEKNELTSLLMAFATFGVGFLMRPIGGILIGYYADRYGRKASLLLIIGMMTFAIAMMSFTPTAVTIGIAAPIIIVISRMIQGFAAGGEFASSTAFVVEAAPPHRKGLYASWQYFGQCLALLAGASIVAMVNYFFTPEQLLAWGWRIPFILGLLICPVGLWMRLHVDENEEYIQSKTQVTDHYKQIKSTVKSSSKGILMSMGLTVSTTAPLYVITMTLPTFAATRLGLKLSEAFFSQAAAVLLMMLIIPFSGHLSDRFGRKPIIFIGLWIMLLSAFPLFYFFIDAPSLERLMLMQFVVCGGMAIMYGPTPAIISEQFDILGRTTAMSIAYNVAVMLFGGFAPFIVTWLSSEFDLMAPAYYMSFAIVIGIIAVYYMRETAPVKQKYDETMDITSDAKND